MSVFPSVQAVSQVLPPHHADQEQIIAALKDVWAKEHYNVERLEALDVSQNYLSEVAVDSLADLADHVEAGQQKGEGEDDDHRYVSVGE